MVKEDRKVCHIQILEILKILILNILKQAYLLHHTFIYISVIFKVSYAAKYEGIIRALIKSKHNV